MGMILVGMVLGLCVFACGEESEEEPQAAAPDAGERVEQDSNSAPVLGCTAESPLIPEVGDVGVCEPSTLEIRPCGAALVVCPLAQAGSRTGLDVDNNPNLRTRGSVKGDRQLIVLSFGPAQGGDEALELGTLMLFRNLLNPQGNRGVHIECMWLVSMNPVRTATGPRTSATTGSGRISTTSRSPPVSLTTLLWTKPGALLPAKVVISV